MLVLSMLGFSRGLLLISNAVGALAVVNRASHPEGQASHKDIMRAEIAAHKVVSVNSNGESSMRQIPDPATTHLLGEDPGPTDSRFVEIEADGAVDALGYEHTPAEAIKASASKHKLLAKGADLMSALTPQGSFEAILEDAPQKPEDQNKTKQGKGIFSWHITEKGVLPLWAQLLCGSLTTAIIMSLFFCVKARIYRQVPRGIDSERLHIVLQETMDRLNELQAQLDDKRVTMTAEAAGEDPEIARARVLQQQNESRAKAIRDAAAQLAERGEQLKEGAERANETFSEAIVAGCANVENFATTETNALYEKMNEAVNEGNLPTWSAPEWLAPNEDEAFVSLPPLMQLLHGAVATRSIAVVKYACHWRTL